MLYRFLNFQSLLICGLLLASHSSADKLRDFKKRMLDLQELKEKCESADEPKRGKCLEKYDREKEKYNTDLGKYKEDVQKESAANSGPGNSDDLGQRITNRKESIKSFIDFVKGCNETSPRCASALYQVANLSYLNEEDGFLIQQEAYEKKFQDWNDHDQRGPEPIPSKRNHDESMGYFLRFLKEYPNDKQTPAALTRTAFIADLQGKEDRSYEFLNLLVTRFPDNALTIPAHLRLGEYWLLKRKYAKAIEHYEKVPVSYGGNEASMALYHRAEAFYNMADFETAAKFYYEYVTLADKGKLKADLRNEAMEFMAACFADLDDGFEVASKFLKSKSAHYPWEDSLFFNIGVKNKAHDRLDEATKAFKFLLSKNPTYADAPVADMHIVEIFVIQKRAEEAQEARMELVRRYEPNSAWYRQNGGNKAAIENAEKAIKVAMYQIPVYYHMMGEKEKDAKLLQKAEETYLAYLTRYGFEDSWDVYQVRQNLAICYNMQGEYKKAAEQYEWCANAPIQKYGKIPDEKKGLINQQDAMFNSVVMLDSARIASLKTQGDDKSKNYSTVQTRDYFSAVDRYMAKYGKASNAADLAYNAAFVHYEAKQYKRAITSLKDLNQNFPNHPHLKLIKRALGQSLLEDGQYAEAEKEFRSLLVMLPPGDEQVAGVRKSIASAMFKQADQLGERGDNVASAKIYERMVNDFRDIDIAPIALFNAGLKYEKANQTDDASRTLLRIHREYPQVFQGQEDLRIKSILRAAKIYQDAKRDKEAAEVFLQVHKAFPKDSMAFLSIGWAAESFDKSGDKKRAAVTFELSSKYYPDNEKTPGFLYNAGQIYETGEMWAEAIRVYDELGKKYPKSSYSVEGVFSVPIIMERRGDYASAAESYERFIRQYENDYNKSIRAHLGAGKNYEKMGKGEKALEHFVAVGKIYEKYGEKYVIPAAIAAEAGFRAGEYYYNAITNVRLNGSKKENSNRQKEMLEKLTKAVGHFAQAAGLAEEEWTLRSTLRMGDMFRTVASIQKDEKLQSKSAEERIAERVQITISLPNYYDKARELYQKNLDLAREQGVQSAWVDSAGMWYLDMYWEKGQAFEEVGKILASAPLPKGLSPEEREEYQAALNDKAFQASQKALPIYKDALRAAAFYGLENTQKQQIQARVRELEPDAPELNLRAEQRPVASAESAAQVEARDPKFNSNMARIEKIFSNPDLTTEQKIEYLTQMEAEARREINRLGSENSPE